MKIKIKKKTEKKILRSFIVISLIVLFLVAGSLFLGLKINFIIGEELNVDVVPAVKNEIITNENNLQGKFEVLVENEFQCKTECQYYIQDLYNNEKVSSGDLFFNGSGNNVVDFTINPGNQFNQIHLYNLDISCNNVKSIFCLTDQKKVHNSALLVVEKNFDEELIKSNLLAKNDLLFLENESYDILIEFEEFNQTLAGFQYSSNETEKLSKELNGLLIKFGKLNKEILTETELWENSTVNRNDEVKELIEQINKIKEEVSLFKQELSSLINLRNSNYQNFNTIIDLSSEISLAYNYSFHFAQELNKINNTYNLITENNFSDNELNNQLNESYTILTNQLNGFNLEKKYIDTFYSTALNKRSSNNISCSSLNGLSLDIDDYNSNISIGNYTEEELSQAWINWEIEILKEMLVNETELSDKINEELFLLNYSHSINVSQENITINSSMLTNFIGDYCNDSVLINISNPLSFVEKVELDNYYTTGSGDYKQEKKCCVFDECKTDHELEPITLFIHGHAANEANTPEASLAAFAEIQEQMQSSGYVNLGQLNLDENINGLDDCWAPLTARATYYYIPVFGIGDYQLSIQKSERIENYALRLKEIIDYMKVTTGRYDINIVAHSMGGLVVREYLSLFGSENINKVVFVNTPHHGVSGKVGKYCSLIGASKECDDLREDSIFLQRLNSNKLPSSVDFYNIRSKGCLMDKEDGDGVVTLESSKLEEVEEYIVDGKCTDTLKTNLHNTVLDPQKYPEVTEKIISFLKED